jgi:NDP-sugar pyrophosphorylase family protein
MIPEGRAVSLEQELFPTLIGRRFMARPFEGYFVDMGTPASYLALRADPSRLLAALA